MKTIFFKLYSIITYVIYLGIKSLQNKRSILFLTKLQGVRNNKFILDHAMIKQCNIIVDGTNNEINVQRGYLWKTNIQIVGNHNQIIIDPDVKIHLTKIILRGNNCIIKIGNATTFGSTYIVCMGKNNSINIGKECMFAEDIEIWNTDSHPIFDANGNITNISKPINIGNHVWCGKGSKILKGVSIGDNAVIGMQALVTKDIVGGTLNVGIPAKSIKENINWDRHFIKC